MSVVIVVGAQWGDEGKGKVVDLLTEKADLVVRWGGGSNAGHTLVVEGKKYVTHLIPSGVLRRGVRCVLGEGMVVDPAALVDEIRAFRAQGLLAHDEELVVAERAHVTLPFHKELDALREAGPGAVGSTRRGIGPTYESKAARLGLRVGDLLRPERFRTRLHRCFSEMAPTIERLGGARLDPDAIARQYLALGEEIRPFVRDASKLVHEEMRRGKNILCEGAQGVLLDLDHGTYPFVTSASTTAGGACANLGLPPQSVDAVVGIAKAYATRVGLGPFPTEQDNEIGARLREQGAEFGATTGRPRRCGWLDIPAIRLAVRVSGIEGLALTKLDVLGGLPTVRLCVGHRLGGRVHDEMPLDPDDCSAVEPVYEDFPGWQARPAGAPPPRSEADLPDGARSYLARVAELSGVSIWLTSIGPGRDETIIKKNPFVAD